MFVRKRKNRTGSISVVVVSKNNGKFVEVKNFGTVKSESEAEELVVKAKHWIETYSGQRQLDFDDKCRREREETERVVGNMDALLINGTQLLLGRIYDDIGFNAIKDEVLRHLVIARLSQPRSKLATVEYLKSYYDEDVNLDRIYNYMDRLYNTQQELVQSISVEHTRCLLGGRLGIVFYDVTTLYFESAQEDELRSPGFSKDGKTSETQVVLGLLVSDGGYPLSYSLYNGKQYEGYTMIPMIDDFRQRYGISEDFVVVADSGLMNIKNIKLLRKAGYSYVIGARINPKQVVEQYHGLWVVERAFRISKGTLEMRPMFHFNPQRIEAHVCICFVAYKVYKELERQIKLAKMTLSVDKVIDIAKTIITMRIRMPENGGFFTKTMFLTERHRSIMPLFDDEIIQN